MSAIGRKRAVLRATIESTSCFTIGTGGGDDFRDALCVTDANGFPAIPGTSLAGVLRHEFGARAPGGVEALFGVAGAEVAQASRIEVSWGQVHDSKNRPVALRASQPLRDEVLEFLRVGVTRDHVSLDGRGAVKGRGKFDETLVPVGARFTFELQLVDPREGEVETLAAILTEPGFRLGGRTRMGHGQFKLVSLTGRVFDLAREDERRAWLALPTRLEERGGLPPWTRKDGASPAAALAATVELVPEDYWLVGGGEPLPQFELKRGEERKPADLVPLTEPRICWSGDTASLTLEGEPDVLLPATSVKGAIRHRFEFLAQCAGRGAADAQALADRVFGRIKDDADALPGSVFFSDVRLPVESDGNGQLEHVSIDRFTAAPMSGMLFNEAPRFRTARKLTLEVRVDGARVDRAGLPLLREALRDLARGRLSLGGGSNRGHGYFTGTVKESGTWEVS